MLGVLAFGGLVAVGAGLIAGSVIAGQEAADANTRAQAAGDDHAALDAAYNEYLAAEERRAPLAGAGSIVAAVGGVTIGFSVHFGTAAQSRRNNLNWETSWEP